MKKSDEPNPVIVDSDRCGFFERNGHRVEVAIYKLEGETEWTLEVIDKHGTSTVWSDSFESDQAAWQEFLRTVDDEGIESLVEPIESKQVH